MKAMLQTAGWDDTFKSDFKDVLKWLEKIQSCGTVLLLQCGTSGTHNSSSSELIWLYAADIKMKFLVYKWFVTHLICQKHAPVQRTGVPRA
jgi:hypothetical protein